MKTSPNPHARFGHPIGQAEFLGFTIPAFIFSVFFTVISGFRLFYGSFDRHRIQNRNGLRIFNFSLSFMTSLALFLNVVLSATLPFMAAVTIPSVLSVTLAYYFGRTLFSIARYFMTPKEDVATRREYRNEILRSGATFLFSGLLLGLMLGIAFVPAFAPAFLALSVLVTITFAASILAGLISQSSDALRPLKSQKPEAKTLDEDADDLLIESKELHCDPDTKSRWDYYFAVRRDEVVRKMTSAEKAFHYLDQEIQRKLERLDLQIDSHFGYFGYENQKRLGKKETLIQIQEFLKSIKPETIEGSKHDFVDAFERYLHRTEYKPDHTLLPVYRHNKTHAFQSFFRERGDLEDIYYGVVEYYEQLRAGLFAKADAEFSAEDANASDEGEEVQLIL